MFYILWVNYDLVWIDGMKIKVKVKVFFDSCQANGYRFLLNNH